MTWWQVVGVVLLLMSPMLYADIKNARRTTCRCCNAKLDTPGGVGTVYLGMGFCHRCRNGIIRKRK